MEATSLIHDLAIPVLSLAFSAVSFVLGQAKGRDARIKREESERIYAKMQAQRLAKLVTELQEYRLEVASTFKDLRYAVEEQEKYTASVEKRLSTLSEETRVDLTKTHHMILFANGRIDVIERRMPSGKLSLEKKGEST